GVEPSGRDYSSNARANLSKWQISAIFRTNKERSTAACVKFSDTNAVGRVSVAPRVVLAGWRQGELLRSWVRPRSRNEIVLRPYAELVRGRRRRSHLPAPQTQPYPFIHSAQPLDDRPGFA